MGYETTEEARMRLEGCVVMYDGNPVFVQGVSGTRGNFIAECYSLPRKRSQMNINIDDPMFDSRRVRLGYMNINKTAVFVTRMPTRKYKQGVCSSNVVIQTLPGKNRYTFGDVYSHGSFSDMALRKYPKFDRCIELLKSGEVESAAFHHSFAVEKDPLGFFILYYKGERIAWGNPSSFTLPSEYFYLEQMIRESGVQIQ